MRGIYRNLAIASAGLMVLASACATDAGSSAEASSASEAADGSTVDVTLQEWAVVPAASSAPAGEVTFRVTNEGPEDVHEFVVIKTDLAADDLPTDETGAVDEEGEGMAVEGEIEDLAVDASEDLTLTLEAGSYVLICNVYSVEEQEAHYQEGMRTAFTVE